MSGRLHGPAAWLLVSITAAMMIFILAPLLVTVAISISNTQYIVFPPRGFTVAVVREGAAGQRLPVRRCGSALRSRSRPPRERCCSASRPPSRWPAREFPGRDAIASVLLSPLVFPVLITGVALLQLFSIMRFRQHADQPADRTRPGDGALCRAHHDRQPAAGRPDTRGCGAHAGGRVPGVVFRRITVPQIAPGLAAGALFAFMISFDNFPISLWLADAQHQPVPLLIFHMIANVFEPSVAAISTLMIFLAMAVVLILERIGGLQRAMAM